MRRFAIAAALMIFGVAGSALALSAPAAIDGARPPSVPEPAAAVLFATGIGVAAWVIRRKAPRS
jgi:hypothetical protein